MTENALYASPLKFLRDTTIPSSSVPSVWNSGVELGFYAQNKRAEKVRSSGRNFLTNVSVQEIIIQLEGGW